MRSVSGLAGLPLVVGCQGGINNAAYFVGIVDMPSDLLERAQATRPDYAGWFDEPGVFAALHNGSVVALTTGETLTDDQITQVARILTLRLSGKAAPGDDPADCFPIYVKEIVEAVRLGEKEMDAGEVIAELVEAAERLPGPVYVEADEGGYCDIDERPWDNLARAAKNARALLDVLNGTGEGGENG